MPTRPHQAGTDNALSQFQRWKLDTKQILSPVGWKRVARSDGWGLSHAGWKWATDGHRLTPPPRFS